MYEWQSFMQTEVKKLGEVLQRHKCRPVCHKYGNTNNCRFLFPHDIQQSSHFDSSTNSIILKCLDSMVNYFNRYILVYCRHNHDLKCILSGKAAKAAMYYISDYITKMDMKTYEVLSLLSRAVASVPLEPELPIRQKGRTLLHKCLAQFTRQQQIHAQQAARYLRGDNDTISSHQTVPMMSGLLQDFLKVQYAIYEVNDSNDDRDMEHIERTFLKIQTDSAGNLINHNQLTNYWYRDHALLDMNFYDFTRCVSLEPLSSFKNFNPNNDRLGVQKKYSLLQQHPLASTHCLVRHTDISSGQYGKRLVPRVIGSTIPRQHDRLSWKFFTLAYFKRFHFSLPFIEKDSRLHDTYNAFSFSERSLFIMKNWEETHECEDKRDEERLRKKIALTTESVAMTNGLAHIKQINSNADESDDEDASHPLTKKGAFKDFLLLQTIRLLEQSQWLIPPHQVHATIPSTISHDSLKNISSFPNISPSQLQQWTSSIKNQERSIAQNRQNASTSNITSKTEIKDTVFEGGDSIMNLFNVFTTTHCPSTSINTPLSHNQLSTTEEIINIVGEQHHLEKQQWIAFRIITRSFLENHLNHLASKKTNPLRMLLTGPGGTGKSHVVKAVHKVMEHYRVGHTIRFLAPTGSAASLIDGMTVHKGLGIKVKSTDKGKGNRKLADNQEDYSVVITTQNKTKLRDEWRLVEIVMIDECSLLSAELLSEINAALRFAKEVADEWFGGITVIFAGDFFQYPPVCATPLYNPITTHGKNSDSELAK